jgi:SpoIID/LytB domain protein
MGYVRRAVVSAALVASAALLAVGGGSVALAATTYPVPAAGLPIHGHGYGNGIGMSQWGADGAASVDHLSAEQILDFYYPHTTEERLGLQRVIRVLLSSGPVATAWAGVLPAAGLAVESGPSTLTLPTRVKRHTITTWRVRSDEAAGSTSLVLQDQTSAGWQRYADPGLGAAATFTDTAALLQVETNASPSARSYHGTLTATLSSGSLVTVNSLDIEDYVRGVVPNEMPSSWPAAALQVQAIAARTYATYQMRHPRYTLWDVYGNTNDQAYGGASTQTSATDAAVTATAGRVRIDGDGSVIYAAYGAADGGETVASEVAGQQVDYLPAQPDPYDDLVPNDASSWTGTLAPSAIEAAFPTIGTVQSVTIDSRDGNGQWGGRITELTLTGSAGSEQVSGPTFAYDLNLRSPWWAAQKPPGAVQQVRVAPRGVGAVSVRWGRPGGGTGHDPVTGYTVSVRPGQRSVTTSDRHAIVRGLPQATSYAVTVRATSKIGAGRPVTVSSAVQRAAGTDPSTAVSRQDFARTRARTAVVVDRADEADGVAGPVLAAAGPGPLLASSGHSLDPRTEAELQRALAPHSTVWLLGDGFGAGVRRQIRALGLQPQVIAAATPAATAVAVADAVAAERRAAGMHLGPVVEARAGALSADASAAAAAGSRHGVLLLAGAHGLPTATRQWLGRHPAATRHRWAVGAAASADSAARPITAPSGASLAVAVVRAVIPSAPQVDIVLTGRPDDALAAAAGAPVLYDRSGRHVPAAVMRWVRGHRSGLQRVLIVGDRALQPDRPVARDLDRALLGG